MKERTSPRPNLTDYVADLRRKKRPTFLDDIEQIVDWHPLEKFLRSVFTATAIMAATH